MLISANFSEGKPPNKKNDPERFATLWIAYVIYVILLLFLKLLS